MKGLNRMASVMLAAGLVAACGNDPDDDTTDTGTDTTDTGSDTAEDTAEDTTSDVDTSTDTESDTQTDTVADTGSDTLADADGSGDTGEEYDFDALATLLSRYEDVGVALADGYVNTGEYVPEMGIHFFNFGITELDEEAPNVLLYDVAADGTYVLVAVEWLVPSDGLTEAPTLFGQTFDGPMAGHSEGQPEHYELHLWLFTDNPDGMFTGFNPTIVAPDWWEDYEQALEAAAAFEDVADAMAAGYVSTHEFSMLPEELGGGGMGIHFVNFGLEGVAVDAPNVLLYTVDDDGAYRLAGIEWFVPSAAVEEAPVLFGQTFDGPMEGHGEGQPEHYDLHVWTHTTNPDGIFAQFNDTVAPPSWWPDYLDLLDAVAAYGDVAEAESAGYVSTETCVAAPEVGAMGVHYVNTAIEVIDAGEPNVLLYMPNGEGGMELVAVEWFVPSSVVEAAPVLFGQTFEGPMEGHEEGQPEHYELHLWTHAANPAGFFAGFNAALACPSTK